MDRRIASPERQVASAGVTNGGPISELFQYSGALNVGSRRWKQENPKDHLICQLGGGNSTIFYFHPEPWVEMGWNHQPENVHSSICWKSLRNDTYRDNCLYKLYLQINIRIHSECMLQNTYQNVCLYTWILQIFWKLGPKKPTKK